MKVNVFNTRIEILPYELGDLSKLEKKWSVWVTQEYRYDPIACYYTDSKLIIPRGMNLSQLKTMTGVSPSFIQDTYVPAEMKFSYMMKSPPRDNNQTQSINFLLSINGFEKYNQRNQLVLNLDTGMGKTYCAIYALMKEKKRTIVITHTTDIKDQWYRSFLKHSTIPEDRILNIDSGKILENILDFDREFVDKDVFVITHSLITDFGSAHGWDSIREIFGNLRIGIKVIDEAHLCFKNTMMIDFFTNVPRNYYLTATFSRSDPKEERIFNNAFSNAVKYGNNLETRKHVNYQFIFFNSEPTQLQQRQIKTNYGVSSYRYADYAFGVDDYHSLERALYLTLDHCLVREGRTLIVVPKIDNTEYLLKQISEKYPATSVGIVNSKHSEDENQHVKENCDIIISTIKSLGVGSDIKKLRNLVIAEPHSSKLISNQLIGRLREYSSEDETYAYELVDVGFPSLMRMIQKRTSSIKKKCKTMSQCRI